MILEFAFNSILLRADMSNSLDISIPLRSGNENPNCFFLPQPEFVPICSGDFVGSINDGGACECRTLIIAPHGNGTHTECIGHILGSEYTINQTLKKTFFSAKLISVVPELRNGDYVVAPEHIQKAIVSGIPDAIVVRTMPNNENKMGMQYSGNNPPYFLPETMELMANCGIEHLLVDLPSVDREEDGGALLAHKAFWRIEATPRFSATITELVYIPNEIPDGLYVLLLQISPIESDASPSKPILFSLLQ